MKMTIIYQCEKCDTSYDNVAECEKCEQECNAPDGYMSFRRDCCWDLSRFKNKVTSDGDIYLGSNEIKVKLSKGKIADEVLDFWLRIYDYDDDDDKKEKSYVGHLMVIHRVHSGWYEDKGALCCDDKRFQKAVLESMKKLKLISGKIEDYKLSREEMGMQGNHAACFELITKKGSKKDILDQIWKKSQK